MFCILSTETPPHHLLFKENEIMGGDSCFWCLFQVRLELPHRARKGEGVGLEGFKNGKKHPLPLLKRNIRDGLES